MGALGFNVDGNPACVRMTAASRAIPRTHMLSTRFVVTSMSYTDSPSVSWIRSIDGPESERCFWISCGVALVSRCSRSQLWGIRIFILFCTYRRVQQALRYYEY